MIFKLLVKLLHKNKHIDCLNVFFLFHWFIGITVKYILTCKTELVVVAEEPHAPQILEDELTDVRGAFAGPFNEGEELRLLCQVHGGRNFIF